MKRFRILLASLSLAAACQGDSTLPDVIDREAFIATYVDLRRSAMESPDFGVTEDRRSEILSRHGVDAESLVRFADVHGPELEYMNNVWTEIDERLKEPDDESEPSR